MNQTYIHIIKCPNDELVYVPKEYGQKLHYKVISVEKDLIYLQVVCPDLSSNAICYSSLSFASTSCL